MRKELSGWQVMSSVFKPNIKPNAEEIEKINSFFFVRYMGANKHSVPIAANINKNYNLPVSIQYRFAKDYSDLVNLPLKVKFIQFKNQKKDPLMEEVLSLLETSYKISRSQAEDYFQILLKTPEGQKKLDEMMEKHQAKVGLV